MKICIPIEEDAGLESRVCAHFGAAPAFLIVDTESRDCRVIANGNQHHGHGMCAPLETLRGELIDGMLVGGIGMGALNKLRAANIQVFVAEHETVSDAVDAFCAGRLQPMEPRLACAAHGHAER